jgi:hypothetical protein
MSAIERSDKNIMAILSRYSSVAQPYLLVIE